MLKGIPKILSPELLKVLCEMGHSDRIVLADGNFPAESMGKNAIVIRADGHGTAELLRAIDGIAQDHILNAHPLTGRGEWCNGSSDFIESGLLIDPARHSDLHSEVGAPVREIAVIDLIAGPGYIRAGVPERLAAEHGMAAFFSDKSGPVLSGIAAYVAAVPPRREIGMSPSFTKRSRSASS